MRKHFLLKTMLLLCALIVGSSSAWAEDETATLSGSSMVKSGSPSTSYAEYNASANIKDDKNYVYTGRWCYQKSGSDYLNMLQIKKTESSNSSRIVLPQFPGDIKSITIQATSTSGTSASDDGAKTRLKIISGTTYTTTYANNTDNIVATAGSSSQATKTYEFDFTGLQTKYDGKDLYICSADGGIRIWSIAVTYTKKTPSSLTFETDEPSIGYPATTTYTQAATAASGYDGTITYALSENSCGATISGATVTVTQEGSVKVTATASATDNYAQSTASYVLTVTDSRVNNDLAYAEASQTVEVGKTLTAPTLTNPHELDVTYESDDTDIATVDASGNVTGVAKGSTTIKAIFAGNNTYKAGTVSYTINVTRAKYDGELFYENVSGYTDNSDGSAMNTSSEYLDSDNWKTLTQAYPGKTGGFKLGSSNNTAKLETKTIALTGNGKLTYEVQQYDSGNAGNLTVSVTGATAVGDVNVTGTSAWVEKTVYLIGGNGEVTITFTTTNSGKRIRLSEILLVEGGANLPITITDAGWASFSNACEVAIPTGVTAYYAQKKDASTVTLKEITGGYIPANTGVVVSGDANTYEATVTATGATLEENNLLKPWLTAGVPEETTDYYTLAVNSENKPIFKKSTGGTLAAGKAYLVMPAGARELNVSFDEEGNTTAIDVISKTEDVRGEVYNLNGQRVAQPTKGLYIVNGKKVVVK